MSDKQAKGAVRIPHTPATLCSLTLLPVPVVTIFKNVTNIITMAGAWFLFGESASPGIMASLGLCVLGAFLAGAADVEPSVQGYFWMACNCLATAAFVLYLRHAVRMKLSVFAKAYYNNILMLPLAAMLAVVLGEWPAAFQAEQWSAGTFWVAILFSGAVGFTLNMASLWCVEETGATTYSMVGAMNKIPITFLGYMFFAAPITSKQWTFIVLSLLGGIVFAWVKAREGAAAKPSAKETGSDLEMEPLKQTNSGPEP